MAGFYRCFLIFLFFTANAGSQAIVAYATHPPAPQQDNPAPGNSPVWQETPGNNAIPEYIEKWEITSARTFPGTTLDKQLLLSPASYFKFVDPKHIEFRLNEFYPVQRGEFSQSVMWIEITADKTPDCLICIGYLKISKESEQSQEYLLEFNGHKQLFTVQKTRKMP